MTGIQLRLKITGLGETQIFVTLIKVINLKGNATMKMYFSTSQEVKAVAPTPGLWV